jgi:hypothetical protein
MAILDVIAAFERPDDADETSDGDDQGAIDPDS